MKREDYIKTIVINGKMINVGIDDYGQTYYLEFLNEQTNELTEACVGPWETDYIGYAEMLFEDPKHCEFYGDEEYCQKLAHTYCGDCDKCCMYIDRDNRYLKKYGMTYNEYCETELKEH